MNRSLFNVLFAGFGTGGGAEAGGEEGEEQLREINAEDAAVLMAYGKRVIIVPGYGMAVAQAQGPVRELMDLLLAKGVDVQFAIHPVAGRMPGHMNVLLAEANVPTTGSRRWTRSTTTSPTPTSRSSSARTTSSTRSRARRARRSAACRS